MGFIDGVLKRYTLPNVLIKTLEVDRHGWLNSSRRVRWNF